VMDRPVAGQTYPPHAPAPDKEFLYF